MNSTPATASQPLYFRAKDPIFLLGMLMYAANRQMDLNFGLPILEVLLPFITLAFVMRDKTLMKIGRVPGILLFMAFIGWVTLSNIVNHISIAGQLRNTIALITLFAPVFLYTLMKERDRLMVFMLGVITCFGLYFAVLTCTNFLSGTINRGSGGDQPTPVVALALWVLFRKQMSKPIQVMLLIGVINSLAVAFAFDLRGHKLSIFIGLAIYAVLRYTPWPRLAAPAIVAAGLMAHWISSFFVASSFDAVISSGKDTVSNMERAYAIDYSRMILDAFPWFGDSPKGYSIHFTDFFAAIAGFSEDGDNIASPHNSFLEYGVFFGYPAAILFVLIIGRLIYGGINQAMLSRSIYVAFLCAGLIRIGAFYGFSGWLRLEWFALMFAFYYAYKIPLTKQEQYFAAKSEGK